MQPSDETYALIMMWRDKPVSTHLGLTPAQTIEALLEVNRLFDEYRVSAGDQLRVLIMEESQTKH